MSVLGPFSSFDELIYAPALSTIVTDFNTTSTLGVPSISLYVLTLGLCCLILSSIGCYLSPNIYVFLMFPALQ